MRKRVTHGIVWSYDEDNYEGEIGDDGFDDRFEDWCDANGGSFVKYSDDAYECKIETGNIEVKGNSMWVKTTRKKFGTNPGRYAVDGDVLIHEKPYSDMKDAGSISTEYN